MRNARLDEAEAGIKIARRDINNLWLADDSTIVTEREEEINSLLMKVKEESERAGLKLNDVNCQPSLNDSKNIFSFPILYLSMDKLWRNPSWYAFLHLTNRNEYNTIFYMK